MRVESLRDAPLDEIVTELAARKRRGIGPGTVCKVVAHASTELLLAELGRRDREARPDA